MDYPRRLEGTPMSTDFVDTVLLTPYRLSMDTTVEPNHCNLTIPFANILDTFCAATKSHTTPVEKVVTPPSARGTGHAAPAYQAYIRLYVMLNPV